jgi:hypothetical protein
LAICASACIENSGSFATTFGYPRHAPCYYRRATASVFLKPGGRFRSLISDCDRDVPFRRRNLPQRLVAGAMEATSDAAENIGPQRSGTISESARLVHGAIKGTIVMRTKYLAAIAIAVLACSGLVVNSVGSLHREKQSTPAAIQVADRLAGSLDPYLIRSGG